METVDGRLLIPLDVLPGPVPAGAPLVLLVDIWTPVVQMPAGTTGMLHAVDGELVEGAWAEAEGGCLWPARARDVALDLSPPPLDADGWPTRIDGADVLLRLIARAALPKAPPHPVAWEYVAGTCWRLWRGCDRHADYYEAADVGPHDPLADRLALAAVLRARPWPPAPESAHKETP